MNPPSPLGGLVVGAIAGLLGVAALGVRRQSQRARLMRRLYLRHEEPPAGGSARLVPTPPWLARALRRAGLPVPAQPTWTAGLATATGGAVVLTVVVGPAAAAVVVVVAAAASVVVLRSLDGRADVLVERGLPAALEAVARSLRSGGSVRTALVEAATGASPPLADDLNRVVRASARGMPLREVLDDWQRHRPVPGVRLAVAALILGVDAGTGLARTLDGVAATLHERAALEREVRVLSTQTRYSAAVLAVAPLAFLAVVAALDPAAMQFLLGSPVGLACLAAGLALDAGAGWWMAHITRAAS